MKRFLHTATILLILCTSCIILLTCCTPSFHQVGDYVDGIAVAQNDEGQYSYIDLKGRLINRKAVLKDAEDFENGHAKVQFLNGKYGFVDKTISVKPPKSFDDISSFYLGHAIYKKDGKYGYIDEQLNEIPLPKYSSIGILGESGYAHVYKNGKCGLINSSYEEVIECNYDEINIEGSVKPVYFIVYQNGKCGVINPAYEEIIECKYDKIGNYGDGSFIASIDNHKGILDINGNFVPIIGEYDKISAFSDGLARVSAKKTYSAQTTQYGFINDAGELIIPCVYYNVGDFKDGKANVRENGVSYDIDKEGNVVKILDMSLSDKWVHYDSYYGNRTFKIDGSSFEYWNAASINPYSPDSGTISRDGNTLTLKGKKKTYTVHIDLENLALEYAGEKYYPKNTYINNWKKYWKVNEQ